MSKYTRNNLTGGLAPLNKELEKIEQVLSEKLDRLPEQGQANQLTTDLDVNNNRILNVPAPSEPTDLVRLKDLDGIGNGSQGVLPPQAGQAGEWLRTDGDTAYWDSLPDFDKGGVSPEDFGAVGDGVTDDTGALQSAINAAKGDGGLGLPVSYVRLENKTYMHTGLTIDRAVAIVGVDRNSTRLKCLSTSAPAIQVALAHDGNNYQVSGRPGPTVLIKDVIIESDKTFASTNEGIELVDASTNPIRGWVYLDGVDIHSMGGNALKASTWEGAVKANNCKFLNNAGKQLNATSCADWQFVGCEFGVTPDDNILLSGSAAFTFTTCNIYSSTGDLVTLFTDAAATAPVNHHFVSCSFDRASNGHGVVYNVRNDGNVTFTNCYWTYNGQGTPETYSDIWIDSSVRRGPTIVGGWMQDASTSDSLYNIFFNGALSSCYTTGVQFEAGNARSTNVTNSLSQLKFEGAENFATFADLEACTWVEAGDKATCIERANAEYIAKTGAALTGDGTAANGTVWALQSINDPRFYGAKADGVTDDTLAVEQCASRADFVTCDLSLTLLVGTVSILSDQKFKDIKFKLAGGTNAECLSCERNAVGCEFIRVEVDGNKSNNTGLCHGIRFNGSTDCKVVGCNIYNTEGQGVQAFIGDTSNINLEIRDNTIRYTDGDSIEVRGSSGLRITGNLCQSWDAGHNAIEFQEPNVDVIVANNTFLDERGSLFAIESAGTPAVVESFIIADNTFKGDYIGVSGRFEKGVIKGNTFLGGVATWRSGIELASKDVIVEGNWIDNGSISIASHGSTVTAYNADNVQILNNFVRNKGADSKALYLGAAASATGTPTCTNIKISGNTFDCTEATGAGGRALQLGRYSLLAQLDGVDITDNVILGDGVTASTRGIFIGTLAGSGKVTVKNNRVSGFANNVNLTDDNLSRFILRNNDLEDFINNAFLDASTTTLVTVSENDA